MSQPNVLFIVLDSVRADRVSPYNTEMDTTPYLGEFADQATVFENAFSPASWTLPSHTSMFTGLTPSEHGVTNWFSDQPVGLGDNLNLLAEQLSEHGYRTAGFSNNPWVGSLTGLDRGFDDFVEWDLEISSSNPDDPPSRKNRVYSRLHTLLGTAQRQPIYLLKRRFFTSQLIDRAGTWLSNSKSDGQPRYAFMNLMEAHSPYFPPRDSFRLLEYDAPGPIEPRLLNMKLLMYVMDRGDLSPELRQRVIEYYDASLRYQDRKLNELLTRLRKQGTYDDTLIVICSDHGKELGEFKRDSVPPHYTRWVNTNIPLIVKMPGQRAGYRVKEPAELTRVHDLIQKGDDSPTATLTTDGFALVEEHIPHSGRSGDEVNCWRVLTDGEYRYIRGDDGQEFLMHNGHLEDDETQMLEWLRTSLDDRISQLEPQIGTTENRGSVSGNVKQQLQELGYLE